MVYFELSKRTDNSYLFIFSQIIFVNLLFSLLGEFLIYILPEPLFQSSMFLFLVVVLFIAISCVSMTCFTNKNLETCWNLVSLNENKGLYKHINVLDPAIEQLAQRFSLTPRECEVLFLLAQGKRAAQIGVMLTISYGTVRTHINHIYAKLNIHTYADLCKLIDIQKNMKN